ncbi:DUF4158 domain-containing protein [Streptomyces sp. NPDC007172]|uniref:DUF4158 domain-containing protein n=1 Tax=Streptomyces sp. NPDC007172 TaxID=3364776 RepID=UPI00368CCEC9
MRQEGEPEDLTEVWTLLEDEVVRLRNKTGANRLGFALLLKSFEVEARFPENAGEVPAPSMAAVVARCRNDHVEPPAPAKVQRLVGRAVTDFEARGAEVLPQ